MSVLVLIIFIGGYAAITLEQFTRVNKAAAALLTGVLCWVACVIGHVAGIEDGLAEHLGGIAAILFFLMGAMTIVELIDAHDGFVLVTSLIRTRSRTALLWIVGIISFLLSSVLDNLTTAIVMTALMNKIVRDREDRWLLVGAVIIAVNAGGAWTPIGDVTTTMLWIGGKVTSLKLIASLVLPSIVCLVVPLALFSIRMRGSMDTAALENSPERTVMPAAARNAVFFTGLGALIFVPVFKTITHLPPYMGILLGLGVLWLLTEILHRGMPETQRHHVTVAGALRRIDMQSILFFLGILLAVSALQSAGHLGFMARILDTGVGDRNAIAFVIGVLSAIVDNVPLVAAAMGMYGAGVAPDDSFWHFLAYTAGTGGSMLIIGSAAGVAAMGMSGVTFFWYLRRVSFPAAIGYCAGAGVYMLQLVLHHSI